MPDGFLLSRVELVLDPMTWPKALPDLHGYRCGCWQAGTDSSLLECGRVYVGAFEAVASAFQCIHEQVDVVAACSVEVDSYCLEFIRSRYPQFHVLSDVGIAAYGEWLVQVLNIMPKLHLHLRSGSPCVGHLPKRGPPKFQWSHERSSLFGCVFAVLLETQPMMRPMGSIHVSTEQCGVKSGAARRLHATPLGAGNLVADSSGVGSLN